MATELRTAQEMYGLEEKIDRLMEIVKADLADRGKIVLHNTTTKKDEILSFNCNLCNKVGNCVTTHLVEASMCHHLEFKEGLVEVV